MSWVNFDQISPCDLGVRQERSTDSELPKVALGPVRRCQEHPIESIEIYLRNQINLPKNIRGLIYCTGRNERKRWCFYPKLLESRGFPLDFPAILRPNSSSGASKMESKRDLYRSLKAAERLRQARLGLIMAGKRNSIREKRLVTIIKLIPDDSSF